MEHIISKILEHSSVPILAPQDHVTGCSIVEQLETNCPKTCLPSYVIESCADALKQMKTKDSAFASLYYTTVYIEAYTDSLEQDHMSQVIYIPFGYWRYHSIGLGNMSTEVQWRAYGWSTQKHKDYATYEHLMDTTSSHDRKLGMVAYGLGRSYAECAAFPTNEMISPRIIKEWSVGMSRHIYDPLARRIREQEAFKDQINH